MRIGVFDSGIGGLTVFGALHEALPSHDLVYLGDTARVPYGTRSAETVIRYSCRVASYLASLQVDSIVIACNTATTYALDTLKTAGTKIGVDVFGVIEPGVKTALSHQPTKQIAVLGTPGTIDGGAYQKMIKQYAPDITTRGVACPLFVPLAEEGWITGKVPREVAEHYLGHLRGEVDVVILGCTHYPLLRAVIQSVLPNAKLVDSASAIAETLRQRFPNTGDYIGSRDFYVTDHEKRFRAIGQQFLGWDPSPITWVDLGPATPPFNEEEN